MGMWISRKKEVENTQYGAPLGTKPERVISAEIVVFDPNRVSWSECWDGKERRKQSGREKGGLVIVL
jgi:hypothetical protein